MAKQEAGPQTHYICQLYEERSGPRGAGPVLAIKGSFAFTSAQQAENRAERAHGAGQCVGADAFSVLVDPFTGDAEEPVFLARFGRVPELEHV